MEKCDFSLSKYIRDNKDITTSLKIDLALQMSQGLAFLHQQQCCHKDIKPTNVLLKIINDSPEKKIIAKLTDMGLIKGLEDSSSQLSSKLDYAAMAWVAPELYVTPSGFSKASDVWALGCVIYFAFTGGRHPFDNKTGRTLADRATNIIKNNVNLSALEQQDNAQMYPEIKQQLLILIGQIIKKMPAERAQTETIIRKLEELEKQNKNSVERSKQIVDQLSKEENNQMIGKIGYCDQHFLHKSNSSCVFLGSFNSQTLCAVKVIAKDKSALDQNRRNELNILINLQNDVAQMILPIVQHYGFEENQDYW